MSADFPDKNGEKLQELQWIAGIEIDKEHALSIQRFSVSPFI